MFKGEIIFYNGFNLLVDIIVGLIVFAVTRHFQWANGFRRALELIEDDKLIHNPLTNEWEIVEDDR